MTPVEALKVLEDLRRYSVGHDADALELAVRLVRDRASSWRQERGRLVALGRALAETVPAVGAAKLLDAIGALVATDGEALASAVEDLKADAK